jgi:hypothetical protein
MSVLSNPSKITRALVASVPGTTAMTAFSYGLSKALNKQFREPELLSYLVDQQPLVKITRNYAWADSKGTGFALHYLAGAGYAAGYEYLWKPFVKLPTLVKGALYGVVAGVIGALVWETVIQLRQDPPRLDKPSYYTHLLLAHMAFGATTAYVSKQLAKI